MAMAVQQLEQTDDGAEFVREIIVDVSRLALNNASLVNEEVYINNIMLKNHKSTLCLSCPT